MKIDFQTALNANDGYGYAAQELILALAENHEVFVEPIPSWYDPASLKHPTRLLIRSTNSCDFQFSFFYPTGPIAIRNKKSANITMYEACKCPNEWVKAINQRRVPIFAPSQFVKEMFENSGISVPIYHLPFGIDQEFWAPQKRERKDRPFRFLIMGKLEPRKNSLFTVKAFQKAFVGIEDVNIVIKTREKFIDNEIVKLARVDNRIKIIDRTLLEEDLRSVYYQCDAFVFVSRGEGFSFPPRFAVATGMPTIVTNWSALAEIPGTVKVDVASFSPMPTCGFSYGQEKELLMADVDESSLIEQMRMVYNNYEGYIPDVKQTTWNETVEIFEKIYQQYY